MVLPDDGGQGDPGSSETPLHHPMILEHLLRLRLQGTVVQFLNDWPMEFLVKAGSTNSGSFRR
jgi:hypothetical protein